MELSSSDKISVKNKSRQEQEKVPLKKSFSKPNFPQHWQTLDFNINGRDVQCLHMPAEKPKALLAFKLGYNSTVRSYLERKGHPDAKSFFDILNERNISVVTLTSDRIAPDNPNFVRDYEEEVRKFLFSADSPVFKIANNLPVHALAHSLGGLATLKQLTNLESLKFLDKNFASASIMNPATAISDVTRFSLVRKFYQTWSSTFPENIPGTTIWGKAYMAFKGIPYEEDNPPHYHIQTMEKEGTALRKNFKSMLKKEQFQLKNCDLNFIVGIKDPTTCPIINLKIAHMLGANKLIFNSKHTPILPEKGTLYKNASEAGIQPAVNALTFNILKNSKQKPVIQMTPDNRKTTSSGFENTPAAIA